MTRERGSGKTPERVVKLINDAVSERSIYGVSKETGLGLAAVSRYMKGVGEPTTATLEKIAIWSGTSVAWLRGEVIDIENIDLEYYIELVQEIEAVEGLVSIWHKILSEDELRTYLEYFMQSCLVKIDSNYDLYAQWEYITERECDDLKKIRSDIIEIIEIRIEKDSLDDLEMEKYLESSCGPEDSDDSDNQTGL